MVEKACRECKKIFEGNICPNCRSKNYSEDFGGIIVIADVKNSKIAETLKITKEGKYATRIR